MKLQRHAAILRLVRGQRIASQDELRKALKAADFWSPRRRSRAMSANSGLAKLTDAQGSYYAQPGDSGVRPDFQAVLGALLTGVDGVGPLLVLRTANGSAGAVAVAIDQAAWGEIIGTVAGEDTLLVITRSEKARERVAARLKGIIGR